MHGARLVLEVADAVVDGERPSQSCLVQQREIGGSARSEAVGSLVSVHDAYREHVRRLLGERAQVLLRFSRLAAASTRRSGSAAEQGRRIVWRGARARRGFGMLEYTSVPMHLPTFRSRVAGSGAQGPCRRRPWSAIIFRTCMCFLGRRSGTSLLPQGRVRRASTAVHARQLDCKSQAQASADG